MDRRDNSTMLFYLVSLTIISNVALVEVSAWMGGSVMFSASIVNKPSSKMPLFLSTSSFTSHHSTTSSHHRRQRKQHRQGSPLSSMTMYFDDISRNTQGHWDPFFLYSSSSSSSTPSKKPFGEPYNEEKHQALKALLGYTTAESTSHLSKIEIEEELRKWAIDTGVVKFVDSVLLDDYVDSNNDSDVDEGDNEQQEEDDDDFGLDIVSRIIDQSNEIQSNAKYDSIASVSVASCTTIVGCLARLWDEIVELVQNIPEEVAEEENSDTIHLVSFPRATDLWDYDQMSKVMMACEFAKQQVLLPSSSTKKDEIVELTLDLFHPKYKNSPKLWSPDKHSPFPTAGIQVKRREGNNAAIASSSFGQIPKSISTLEQLESLFLSAPALHTPDDDDFALSTMYSTSDSPGIPASRYIDGSSDVLRGCNDWMKQYCKEHPKYSLKFQNTNDLRSFDWVFAFPEISEDDNEDRDGAVTSFADYNYFLYKTLWATLRDMERQGSNGNDKSAMKTRIIVAEQYHDTAENFQRFAVTINAALKRLAGSNGGGQLQLRVAQVFHPSNANPGRRAPYPMIELEAGDDTSKTLP